MFRFHSKTSIKFLISTIKKPMRIAVTGAAGQICYSLLFRIANGDMLGYDQPVILHLIDIPNVQKALSGVAMQLGDCAFPLLKGILCTDKLQQGFKDIDAALLIGAKPRTKGMERSDLLNENANIFISQGKALNKYANRNVKVLVVGNPANTNALITATYAKDIPKQNFSAMTRLDHDRTICLIKQKCDARIDQIKKVAIWGNHSSTMFPDLTWTTVGGFPIFNIFGKQWYYKRFIPRIQNRGAEIIQARGLSSAASAGNAAINHMKSWFLGHDDWISFGVWSPGNLYDIPEGLFFSFPVEIKNGQYNIVKDLIISAEQRDYLNKTTQQLLEERKAIAHLLKV